MKSKVTLLNMISSFILQLFTIISGFIIPQIILSYFGSTVNGLVSSLNQFLSYISLLEGGISGVIMANLYTPLINKDEAKISSIIRTSKDFFQKIAYIFILYAVIVSVVYPLIVKDEVGYYYVFALSIVLSVNLFIQYMFSLSVKTLLNADKKVYVVSFTQIAIITLNIVLVYISVKVFPSIHVLKLISGLLYILQPVVYNRYIKKHYNINPEAEKDKALVSQRWNGFAINVAAFIHNSTDIVILTLFTDLKTVSVYGVYALVTNGLRGLITSITSGINPSLGQAYAKKDENELNKKLDIYEYIVFLLVGFPFTVAAKLITPFVMIYTKNINDAPYNQPLFGYLFILSEALYLIKFPHLNLAYTANKFKEITLPAYVEASINIVLSLILVNRFGLVGVAIGTTVAMVYRMIYHISFTKKIFSSRKQSIFYRKLVLFVIASIIGLMGCNVFPVSGTDIWTWILHALMYCLIIGGVYLAFSILFFKEELKFFLHYMRRK